MSIKSKESKRLELVGNDSGEIWSVIKIEGYPKTDTMIITLEGKQVTPYGFNSYRQPLFTYEFYKLYNWRRDELAKENNLDFYILKFNVEYESQEFSMNTTSFDTIEGIQSSLVNLKEFNNIIKERQMFYKITNLMLHKFVVFGKYILDEFGQINTIDSKYVCKIADDVMEESKFNQIIKKYVVTLGTSIPNIDMYCNCCCKKWIIDDLKESNSYILKNGKAYHKVCWDNYRKKQEIEEFTLLFRKIYNEEIPFNIIPNEYCTQECCENIPWFIFNTPDGDIKIGWRKRVISITWLDNYSDFAENFEDEDVTKSKRAIHAWGTEKASEYIIRAKESIIK